MPEVPSHRQCGCCYFCRSVAGQLCCLRNAPAADPATGRARWPAVEPTDFCGAFCQDAPNPQSQPPNRQSSIIHHQCPSLPVCTDAFGDYCKIPRLGTRPALASRRHPAGVLRAPNPEYTAV